MERVGKCSVCGRDAAWNTPHVHMEDNVITLYCNKCAYDSKFMVYGVNQHMENGEYIRDLSGHYTKNHCTITTKMGVCGWTDDGIRSYFMDDYEKEKAVVNPELVLDQMIRLRELGKYKCSECGVVMDEKDVASFPLFSGVICENCNITYEAAIGKQRRTGQVCRMCRQPYLLCCC